MRSAIDPIIIAGFTALSKQPIDQVLVGYTLFDITGDVLSIGVEEDDTHEANTATLKVSNANGQYDLLSQVGSSYQWLRQNEPIYIKHGYSSVLDTVFTGFISAVRGAHYERGQEQLLNIQCQDCSKSLFKGKVTTIRYESRSINDILTNASDGVLTEYGKVSTDDLNITGLSDTVPWVQFNEEYPMDAAFMLTQVKRHTLRFRYDGKVENFSSYGSTVSADCTVTGTYIQFLETSWDDYEIANKVIVTGALAGTRMELDAEELQGSGYVWTTEVGHDDYTLTFTNPPVDINTIRLVFTKEMGLKSWEILSSTEEEMIIRFHATRWYSWGISGFDNMDIEFKAYCQHISTINVYVQGTALSNSLYNEYGGRWIIEEVENPCISVTNDATALASNILSDTMWRRYKVSVSMPDRFDIQPGDTLKLWNKEISRYYWVYVQSMTHQYTRGRSDDLVISGYWMKTSAS